jgi:hypothetical protein
MDSQTGIDRRTLLLAISGALGLNFAWGAQGSQAQPFKRLPRDFSLSKLEIDPPPVDDMLDARKVLAMLPLRTPERVAEIQSQALDATPLLFQIAGLNPSSIPLFGELVSDVQADMVTVVLSVKAHFNRARPNTVLPQIDPVIPVPWHSSYPNGHAAQSLLTARLLGCASPSKLPELLKFAARVGQNREIAGVHYPSDTRAGTQLADSVWPFFGLDARNVAGFLRKS